MSFQGTGRNESKRAAVTTTHEQTDSKNDDFFKLRAGKACCDATQTSKNLKELGGSSEKADIDPVVATPEAPGNRHIGAETSPPKGTKWQSDPQNDELAMQLRPKEFTTCERKMSKLYNEE